MSVEVVILDSDGTAFDEAELAQSLSECVDTTLSHQLGKTRNQTDPRDVP